MLFHGYWSFIDRNMCEKRILFDGVTILIEDIKQEVIKYWKKYLEEQSKIKQSGDYKEFLELVIFFVGAVTESKVDVSHQPQWRIPPGYPNRYIQSRFGCSISVDFKG